MLLADSVAETDGSAETVRHAAPDHGAVTTDVSARIACYPSPR